MLKRTIYESWAPVPENYKQDCCDMFNRGIDEEDRMYGTRIGSYLHYTPDFFDNERQKYGFDACTVSKVEPGIDKVIAACFMNPNPLCAWKNYPEWFDGEIKPVYLSSFGVASDQRGRGIGTDFLNWLMNEYSKRGFGSCVLRMDDENDGARRLYEKAGFVKKIDLIDPYDGVMKHIMVLKLH